MCPIYAVLAAPLARPLGVPVLLWYTHWRPSRTLRLAERLATRVVSVDKRSFPIDSPKVRGIGHGIDLAEFECAQREPGGDFRALVLGRYSEAKGLETVLRGVRLALDRGLDLRLEAYGPALNPTERTHRTELEQLVAELDLGRRVRLGHALLRSELPEVFGRADVLLNNMRAGAPDKAVYEAGASCVPVLASNPVFDELLEPELRFAREDPGDLAAKLRAFAARSDRDELGSRLRERVAERHSVSTWAEGILKAARA
jgi:glycosyltransferase involved in cell wall biosynthesis